MKSTRSIITGIVLLLSVFSSAQSSLPNSPRSSAERHIYKMKKEDLRKVYLKEEGFGEEMLKNFIAKYKNGEQAPILPRGNYVEVSVIENQLNYNELVVDDLYAKIVPSENFMICLYDSLGNIIDDAKIKKGASTLKFCPKTQTYTASKAKDEQIIEIDHKGVFHYLEVDNYRYDEPPHFFKSVWWKMKSWWWKTKRLFQPSERSYKQKYTGFIVFNKPKYKPGETVKLKAYLTEKKGKRYNKAINLRLHNYKYSSFSVDTLLTRLEPYQPGMYTYEFKLTDDLDLTLDANYTLSLVTDDKGSNQVNNYFRYEDYELKSIHFSLKSNKEKFIQGDSIKLTVKATDENQMPVYDGTLDILVTPGYLNQNKMKRMETLFIPDTLWFHSIEMFGSAEKELVLPDSIFPPNIDMDFTVKCTYLSSDNEKHIESLYLSKLNEKHQLDFSLNKGELTIKELYLGESQPVTAQIIINGENDEYIYKDSVKLPHTLSLPWYATEITVKTKHTKDYYFLDDADEEQLGYEFYRKNDSIFLKVNNPAHIPFWYSIRKMKKEIAKGYTTQLNYARKDTGEEGYSMQLSYLFGGKSKSIEETLPFVQKNITIDITTPTTVYPGQKTNVQISVHDKKGNPVEDADITAYSFTSKFKNYSMPNIPIGGKAHYAKSFQNTQYKMDSDFYYYTKSNLTWERWAEAMSLDTLEFYKFLYPDTYYIYKEPSANGQTRISPFVVINGEVQGVHMLWIDDRLYYTYQSQHFDICSIV